jgi:hypothetical protein
MSEVDFGQKCSNKKKPTLSAKGHLNRQARKDYPRGLDNWQNVLNFSAYFNILQLYQPFKVSGLIFKAPSFLSRAGSTTGGGFSPATSIRRGWYNHPLRSGGQSQINRKGGFKG